MVKRLRFQSTEAPMRRSWFSMALWFSSFQSQMRCRNSSRVKSYLVLPSALSWRSTTIWVAMPA